MRTFAMLFLGTLLATGATAGAFSSLYFFGDSLSDTGNVFALTTAVAPLTLGQVSVTPAPPYVGGRFSNGPNVVDAIAWALGRPGDGAAAGVKVGNFGEIKGVGNNYAIGGARTSYGGALGAFDAIIPTGVLWQTQYYLSTHGNAADPNALYFFSGGGNDIRDAALIADPAGRKAAAEAAADYLAYSVLLTYQAGGRKIVLSNAPDVGKSPEAQLVRKNSAAATDASIAFNNRLFQLYNYLTFIGASDLMLFDLYSTYNYVYADAVNGGKQFGLTNYTTPCFAGFAGSKGADCSKSFFADDLHPTSGLHILIGNYEAYLVMNRYAAASASSLTAFSSTAPIPEPGSAALVMAGLVVVAMRARARLG